MKKILAAVIAFAVVIIPQTQVNAENSANELKVAQLPEELTPEDVYAYLWEQTVVTVSRREQKISEAPASVTVITAEDIKRSGALNIYELLRPVVGMDVVGLTQTGPAISIRGFNTALVSRTILVLLNGNPVYQEVNMSPMWSMIPITLQEIERIEIVRGAGSALWGANAYSGVINIITKSPGESPTYQISESIGDLGATYTNFIHAHKTGNTQYRLQYGHDQIKGVTLNPKHFATKHNVYKFDLSHKDSKQRELILAFGYANPILSIVNPVFVAVEARMSKEFFHLTYKLGDTWIKIRQNHTNYVNLRQGFPYIIPGTLRPFSDKTISAEFQTTKRFQYLGILTYGAEYKFVDAFFFSPPHTQGLGSLFAQDELAVNKKLLLSVGTRIDSHPETKTAFSPRLSIMYTPLVNHIFRIGGSTSYRRPAYNELYANTTVEVPFPPFSVPMIGNKNIKAEKIQSLEMGYTGRLTGQMKLSINLYRNILDNFINQILISGQQRFINRNKATQNGAEVELETFFSQSLKGFVNYAFNQTKNTQTGGQFEMSPKHKANAGLGWMPKSGPYSNLVFNYVDDTGQTIGGVFKRVEPYRNVDVNFGYRFSKKLEGLEMGLNAQNVFNKKRKEHPAGDTFKRRVVGTVSYAF